MIKRFIESKRLIVLKQLVNNKTKKAILVVILAALLGALGASGLNAVLPQHQTLVTFDMKGTLSQFMKQVEASHMSSTEKQTYTKAFFPAVADATSHYAKTHHVVILAQGAVVGGNVPDVTAELQQLIEQRLQSQVKP